LPSVKLVGRLVIDLERVLAAAPGSPDDRLRIAKCSQEVTVIGESQSLISHSIDRRLPRDDDPRMRGGTTPKTDDKRIYVVLANSTTEAVSGSRWFRQNGDILPGYTILVPCDAEFMRPLATWMALTSILFNLAAAMAAVSPRSLRANETGPALLRSAALTTGLGS
jgi:hypothetical protein